MNESRNVLGVCLDDLDFRNALGVPRYFIATLVALASRIKIHAFASESSIDQDLMNLFHSSGIDLTLGWLGEPPPGLNSELVPHQFAKPRLGRPFATVIHDFHVFDIPAKYSDAASKQALIRWHLTHGTTVTPFPRVIDEVFRVTSVVPRRMVQIPHFPLSSLAQKTSVQSTEVLLIYPAQYQVHKNHFSLLSFHRAARRVGLRLKTVCFGSDSPGGIKEQLRAAVRNGTYTDGFLVLDRQSDIEVMQLFQKASAVVSTSSAEGGAQVALEAAMNGKRSLLNEIDAARSHCRTLDLESAWFNTLDQGAASKSFIEFIRSLALSPHRVMKAGYTPDDSKILDKWMEVVELGNKK